MVEPRPSPQRRFELHHIIDPRFESEYYPGQPGVVIYRTLCRRRAPKGRVVDRDHYIRSIEQGRNKDTEWCHLCVEVVV